MIDSYRLLLLLLLRDYCLGVLLDCTEREGATDASSSLKHNSVHARPLILHLFCQYCSFMWPGLLQ